MTAERLIEYLRHHQVDPDTEVIIDGATRQGEAIELTPVLTRVRGGRLLIVADEVVDGA